MNSLMKNLKLLDNNKALKGIDIVSELFHKINRIIPQDQKVLTFKPSDQVREAIKTMHKYGYSQVPVVGDGPVLGVFSFRSFSKEAASTTLEEWKKQQCAPGDLEVVEFLEKFEFTRVTEEISHVFDVLNRDNGILVGAPERLVGILTPIDFISYLYQVASPFVMLSEIELALRVLIESVLSASMCKAQKFLSV